ncbi:MAG TPA: amidase [Xanthobacteraceae bacterium]|nr:amidase [Xanthobacteraceae bacterium]
MTAKIHGMTAAELSAAFKAKKLSPVAAAEAFLKRIETLDEKLNCFCLVDRDAALTAAKASEARWKKGAALSPLDGVPVAIKDILVTKGWPTLRGSRTVDPKGPWDEDAPTVARLKEAGAVLVGKTTTPEFGWKAVTDSPLTGITRNPWNTEKTPGGSSGGSSAAIAGRLVPIALGTDGGGSIRIPCALTGLPGLKPSFGRVAAYPLSPFGTVAHVGPMSRTVTDLALMMNVLAKPDARDWHNLPYDAKDYMRDLEAGIRGKRIAFSLTLGGRPKILLEVEGLVRAAIKRLEDLGAHVEAVDPPMADAQEIFHAMWWSGAGYLLGALPEEKKALLDPLLRKMADEGAKIPLRAYFEANTKRGALGSRMRVWMERFDFIATPSVATVAFDVGRLMPTDEATGNAWLDWTPFSFPFNLTQQPAASVPCGFTKDGLPVGLQLVGKMYDDAGVLAAARAYEAAHPLFDKAPPGFE